MDEIHKRINDLAVSSGRALQSQETQALHYFHGKREGPHQAIPMVENLLFALALFRTKTVEGVQEGKQILEKMLAYQQPNGLLPTYLHDFPYCYDKYMGALTLPPLFLIHHHFSMRLGPELGSLLQKGIEKMVEGSLLVASQMPYPFQVRLGGALAGAGSHFCRPDWIQKGEALLEKKGLLEFSATAGPSDLGHCLLGAMLAGSEFFEPVLKEAGKKWNSYLECYVGPFDVMFFSEGAQELTLYDLFMAAHKKHEPRSSNAHPILLQGAQLFPSATDPLLSPIEKKWACSFSSKSCAQVGCYPFVFQWGKAKQVMFLALSAPKAQSVAYNDGDLIVDLGPDSREEGQELVWYLPLNEGLKIRVNGQAATTFRPQDVVTIEDEEARIELIFEGEGIFQGHLSKGCMPTETVNFGKKRFDAYQWQLAFRSVSRPDNSSLKISFRYDPQP